jgi:hypothetical protein
MAAQQLRPELEINYNKKKFEFSLHFLHYKKLGYFMNSYLCVDRLCGLVVRVLGYRSGGPGSIPGTTRFSEKKKKGNSSGSGTGST